MTDNHRADRLFVSWLESEAPDQAPHGLLDKIDSATRSARPRPGWVARLEGHHMEVIEGGRGRRVALRPALLFAIIALVVLVTVGTIIFVGSRVAPAPVVPGPSPAAVAKAPQASTAATPRPSASTFMQAIQPGERIPDELIGTWYAIDFDEYTYISRAGDPICVQHWRTAQDCVTFYSNNEFARNGDVVTLVDGHLRFWPIGPDRCADTANLVDYVRSVDQIIRLRVLPGQCFTDMSDLRSVTPPFSPAPTLPPY
jgi:hypothetical protein